MKRINRRLNETITMSLPTRERELKHARRMPGVLRLKSLPTRERELKLVMSRRPGIGETSLPTRERELKLIGLIPPPASG